MISLIVPTCNESGNIIRLISYLRKNLKSTGQDYEIIIVDDDSNDLTWKIAGRYAAKDLTVIRRIGQKGLASAVVEGFNNSHGDILGVIDADLSHPPQLIKQMVDECRKNDIVIASRYIAPEKVGLSISRRAVSWMATLLAKPLTSIRDPMSGYFFLKRKVIKDARLAPVGYKILLEILVKGHYNEKRVLELSFPFGKRYFGKSKLKAHVYMAYLFHVLRLYCFRIFH